MKKISLIGAPKILIFGCFHFPNEENEKFIILCAPVANRT